MFKPQTFRFKSTIHWPGVGPASEIAATNIARVDDEGDDYLFVHASGHAVKVPKAQVTAYGVYDADDVPNLPTSEDYKDGTNEASDNDGDSSSTRLGGNSTPLPTEPKGPETVDEDTDDTENESGEYGQSDESKSAKAEDKSTLTASTDADVDDEFQSSDDAYSTPADSDDAFEAPATDTEEAGSVTGSDSEKDYGTDFEANVYDAFDSGSTGDTVQSDDDAVGDSAGDGCDDEGGQESDATGANVEAEGESALSKFFSTSKKKSKKSKK